jgi:hypothetical protein
MSLEDDDNDAAATLNLLGISVPNHEHPHLTSMSTARDDDETSR